MLLTQSDGADVSVYGGESCVTCDRTSCDGDSWLSIAASRKLTALGAGSLCVVDGVAGDNPSLSGSKIAFSFSLPCGVGFCHHADHVCAFNAPNYYSFLLSNIHHQ